MDANSGATSGAVGPEATGGKLSPGRAGAAEGGGSFATQDVTLRGMASFLWDRNPFYLLSALLAIYAQSAIFTADPLRADTELPALLLASYTAILAAAGVLIVRFGKVWEDARSVILIVLVLLQMLPAGLDGIMLDSPNMGWLWMGGMLALSVFVSELLRRGLRMSISKDVLCAHYLFMLLNCAWPLLLSFLVRRCEADTRPVAQAILLFPALAGILLFGLIPAVRRGPEAAKGNGTPWTWPCFPWSAFMIVVAGICFRTYLMAISFVGGKGAGPYANLESGFLPWMLAWLLLAVGVLLTEEAARRPSALVSTLACSIPFLALALCAGVPSCGLSYSRTFTSAIPGGHPPFALCVPFVMAYLAWGCLRGVKGMGAILHCALGAVALRILFGGGSISGLEGWSGWLWLPVALFSADMLLMAFVKRHSAFMLLGLLPATIYACSTSKGHGAAILLSGTLLSIYLGGALFKDSLSQALRMLAAALIPFYLFCSLAFMTKCFPEGPGFLWGLSIAVAMLVMTAIGFAFISRRDYALILSVDALILLGFASFWGWGFLRSLYEAVKHAVPLALSLFTLAFAVLISLMKGGLLSRLKGRLDSYTED